MEKFIRQYKNDDCSAIVKMFRETVHAVNARDYTAEQLAAWAPAEIDEQRWQQTLSTNHTVVAESGDKIIGFGDIDATGYFDHLFVHKDYQGQGVATLIADAIEQHAAKLQIVVITVAASITAKPFFISRGYTVLRQQSVERNGQVLTNFLMEKRL